MGFKRTEIDNREILASYDSQTMVLKDKIERDNGEKCYIYPNGMIRYSHGDSVKNVHIDPFKTPTFGFVSGTDNIQIFKYGLGVMTIIDLSTNNERVYKFADQRTKVKENTVKNFNGLIHVLASNGMYPYSLFRSERGNMEDDFHFTKTDYVKPFVYPIVQSAIDWVSEEPGSHVAEPPPPPTHQIVTFSVQFGSISVKDMVYGTIIKSGDKVAVGTQLFVTAAPEEKYQGNKWKINNVETAMPGNNWTTTVGLEPIDISIQFIKHTYLIEASTISSFGSLRIPYEQGETQIVTIRNIGTGIVMLAQPTSDSFELGPLSPLRLNPNDTAQMAIRPLKGLNSGPKNEEIIISGNDGAKTGVVASVIIQPAYTYILADDSATQFNFGEVRLPNYPQPAARTVTVKNNGTGNITGVNIVAMNSYILSELPKTTLLPNETMSFTIQPKDDITQYGNKNENLVIKGDNNALLSIPVLFTVQQEYTFGITIRYGNQTTVTFDERALINQTVPNSQPPAVTLTVANTGSGPVRLTPPVLSNDSDWTIPSSLSAGVNSPLPASESATFTLRPKNNIGAGAHTTLVTVKGSGQHANNGATVNVETNPGVTASYNVTIPATHTVSFNVNGSGGSIRATVDGGQISSGAVVEKGKRVVFTATPESSHNMGSWGGDLSGSELSKEIIVGDNNINVSVSFTIKTYSVTINQVQNGSISAKRGEAGSEVSFTGGNVDHGARIVFTANPGNGYEFDSWSVVPDGGDKTGNTLEMRVLNNVTIGASMRAVPKRNVSWNVSGGEMIIYNKDTGTELDRGSNKTVQIYEGVTIKMKAVASSGYLDNSVWTGGSPTNNEWEVYIGTDDVNITVVFEKELIITLNDRFGDFFGVAQLVYGDAVGSGLANLNNAVKAALVIDSTFNSFVIKAKRTSNNNEIELIVDKMELNDGSTTVKIDPGSLITTTAMSSNKLITINAATKGNDTNSNSVPGTSLSATGGLASLVTASRINKVEILSSYNDRGTNIVSHYEPVVNDRILLEAILGMRLRMEGGYGLSSSTATIRVHYRGYIDI